jgi:uncharacterized protein YdbL (DUF1318 family)
VRLLKFVALLALCVAVPAAAQNSPAIRAAKAAGQVGERYDGYLGVAGAAPAQVRREVEIINIRRRAHFSNLAASRGVSPQDVGLTTGCLTLGSVEVGEAYLLVDNIWRRRAQRQSPPVPSYCRP